MCAVEIEKLSDQERSDWEAMCSESYEESGFKKLIDEESYNLICDICSCALEGDFEWMLETVANGGVVVARTERNPEFRRLLKRAYEHAVACGNAGACCNLANMYHKTSGDGSAEDYTRAIEIYELGGRPRRRAGQH